MLCCQPKHQNMLMGVPQRGTNVMEMFSQLPSTPGELLLGDARLNAGSVLTYWGRQGCPIVWLTQRQTCHPCCLPQPSPHGRRSGMEAILGGKFVCGAGSTRKQGHCGRRKAKEWVILGTWQDSGGKEGGVWTTRQALIHHRDRQHPQNIKVSSAQERQLFLPIPGPFLLPLNRKLKNNLAFTLIPLLLPQQLPRGEGSSLASRDPLPCTTQGLPARPTPRCWVPAPLHDATGLRPAGTSSDETPLHLFVFIAAATYKVWSYFRTSSLAIFSKAGLQTATNLP